METQSESVRGHVTALATILIWGMTFISTKVLLVTFTPLEILFLRFAVGFVALLVIYPRRLKLANKKQEGLFIGAGISGITLYFLLENVALTMTTASNVGIIVTIAPFFTALLSIVFLKAEKPKVQFYIGFVVAIVGIGLISYNGNGLELNPMGDLLAILAAAAWAIYSILIRKIADLGHDTIPATRRVFMYGLLFIAPLLFVMDFNLETVQFASFENVGNILFLGLGASALCFVTWNIAVKLLGAVKTSVYIYLVPVVTVTASILILKEPVTPVLIIGASFTLVGLWISETKLFGKTVRKASAQR